MNDILNSKNRNLKEKNKMNQNIVSEKSINRNDGPVKDGNSIFFKRFYMTVIMLGFLAIIVRFKTALLLTVYILKIIAYNEVTHIARGIPKKISGIFLNWYLLFVSDFFLWRTKIGPFLRMLNLSDFTRNDSNLISFTLYVIAIVFFIITLRKGTLMNQSIDFVLSHIGILMINCPSYCILRNIMIGKFWFVFPVLLVISNDVSAYIVGKLFGKTPLIRISPKKTVEGFIGGFIFTILTGIILTYVKIHTKVLDNGDDKNILLEHANNLKFPMLYLHTIVFILFSSFCAPFGGLLASTFKRIFRMKDFATYLPGHGGITDRVDCQLLMGIFTRFYIVSFVYLEKSPADVIVKGLVHKYTRRELMEITARLAEQIIII